MAATAWRRLMCIAYECVILFGVTFFFGYAFSTLTQFKGQPGALRWVFQGFMLVVLAVYFTWFWSQGRRTLPMKTMSVRLCDSTGRPLTPARAFARFCAGAAMLCAALAGAQLLNSALILLAAAPAAWALFDPQRRALYDLAAGTRLVLSPG